MKVEMRILVTGFDPFGEDKENPSTEILKKMSDEISGAEILKIEVPTVFNKSLDFIVEAMSRLKPDVVISLGQAGGRTAISIERVAINVDDARIKDNEGNQPIDEPIDPSGPNALFSSLPIKAITQELKAKNIPAVVSNTAGTFVCNHVMYGVLRHIEKERLDIRAGFIHIPYETRQVIQKPSMPSMNLMDMVKGIEIAIKVIIQQREDIVVSGGSLH